MVETLSLINLQRSHYYNQKLGETGTFVVGIKKSIDAVRTEIQSETEFLHQPNQVYYADSIKKRLTRLQNRLVDIAVILVKKEKADFHLDSTHIQDRIRDLEALPFPLTNFTTRPQKPLARHQIQRITLDLLNIEYALTSYIMSFISIRDLEFPKYFPVVIPEQDKLAVGENFTAKIGVGHYYSPVKTEDIAIRINGKSIAVDADGIARYSFMPTITGEYTLNLEAEMTNTLTGEISSGESTYIYRVIDCK